MLLITGQDHSTITSSKSTRVGVISKAVGLAVALGAFGTAASAQTIDVGVLTARSGAGAPVGEEIVTGIQTAMAMYGLFWAAK